MICGTLIWDQLILESFHAATQIYSLCPKNDETCRFGFFFFYIKKKRKKNMLLDSEDYEPDILGLLLAVSRSG